MLVVSFLSHQLYAMHRSNCVCVRMYDVCVCAKGELASGAKCKQEIVVN